MTDTAPRLDRRGQAALQAERRRLWAQAQPEAGAWHAGSSLLSGVLVVGGAGWLLQHWLGWPWLTPSGVLLGTALGMTTLWFRYGVARLPEGDPCRTSDEAARRGSTGTSQDDRPTDPGPMEDAP